MAIPGHGGPLTRAQFQLYQAAFDAFIVCANSTRPQGEWNSYDIFFEAPKFDGDKLVLPARVTVFHNGVLVQANRISIQIRSFESD